MIGDDDHAQVLGLLKAEAMQPPGTQAQKRRRAKARAAVAREFVRMVDAGDTPDADTLRTIADMLRGLEAVDFTKANAHNSPVAKALGLSGTWAKDAGPGRKHQHREAAVIFGGPEVAARQAAKEAGPEGTIRFERALDGERRRAYELQARRRKKGR
jgi:hypothetical protein